MTETVFSRIEQPNFPDAECKNRPGLPWVPPDPEDAVPGYAMAEMRRVCDTCVHLLECQTFAIMNPSLVGVWGGLSTMDRQRIRKNGRLTIR